MPKKKIVDLHIKKINIVQLASELADKNLRESWDYDTDMEFEEDGVTMYTEEAQDIFNMLYDEYYDMILQSEEN